MRGIDVRVVLPAAHDGMLAYPPSECGQRSPAVRQDQTQPWMPLEDAGVQGVGDVPRGVEGKLDD